MYQSGQRWTLSIDTSPLSFNLDFQKPGYDFSKDEDLNNSYSYEEQSSTVIRPEDSDSDIDYNYLME